MPVYLVMQIKWLHFSLPKLNFIKKEAEIQRTTVKSAYQKDFNCGKKELEDPLQEEWKYTAIPMLFAMKKVKEDGKSSHGGTT